MSPSGWDIAPSPSGLTGNDIGYVSVDQMDVLAVQGLYFRSTPSPSGEASIFPLVAPGDDPNNPTYMWAAGSTSNKLGFTTDHGATFTAVIAFPTAQSIQQITITTNFLWMLTSDGTSRGGQLWRSPAPNASGSNLAFTKIQDLTGAANGTGGGAVTANHNTSYRNACLAVQSDESRVYLLTYGGGNDTMSIAAPADCIMTIGNDIVFSPTGSGSWGGWMVGMTCTVAGAGAAGAVLTGVVQEVLSQKKIRLDVCAQTSVIAAAFAIAAAANSAGTIQNGPTLYVSSTATLAAGAVVFAPQGPVANTFQYAKHGHAVKIIGGVPWVSNGDFVFPPTPDGNQPVTHVGLWAATDATATAWRQKMVGSVSSATPYDMINFFPITIAGQPMIVGESDSALAPGPIFFPSQSNAVGSKNVIVPLQPLNLPQVATMRGLSITPEGNLMWLGTGESGSVGPIDTIMLWKLPWSPFTPPVVLETSSTNVFGAPAVFNAITDGAYTWFGNMRVTREKFKGQ